MKKRFIALIAILLSLIVAGPAAAELQNMWASVYALTEKNIGDTQLTPITTGITFKVLATGSTSAETLYVTNKETSLTNPVSTTNFAAAAYCGGKVAFRVDPTDATNDRYVDLIVTDTNGGYSTFVKNFDKFTHKIVIDERPNMDHLGVIWFSSPSVSTDTEIVFLPQTRISDVMVEIVTADSGKVLFIGTSADSDTFRTSVLATTTGFVQDTAVVTNGTIVDYYPATNYGAGLTTAITGSDTTGAAGGNIRKPAVIAAADTTSYLWYSGNSSTAAGYIYYIFNRMR